ncbi:MAG TPA: serine hydrolase domain-containing protein [Steroidobacteraceae bacterium]
MKAPRFLLLFVLSLQAAAAPAALPAVSQPQLNEKVRESGRQWLEDYNGVGLSVGIYDAGRSSFYNFGSTQLDGSHTPTKDTIYEIGSISKTFAGQLLARAVVEGRASLGDEAEKYLGAPYPNLANGGEKVRLIHLANLTSQLVDNIPDLTQVRAVAGEPMAATRMKVIARYTRDEFLKQLHRVAPRLPPGSDPAQSNVAGMLLGVVLERIYDESFDVMLAREIEKPLRMGSGTQPDAKLLAKGYTREGEPLPPFAAKLAWPSVGLRYSTDSLLRYASWQLVERDASVKLAHQPTWFTPDRQQSVAMYWIVSETSRGRRLHYGGGTYGFSSLVELYPEQKLAIVALSNKAAEGAQDNLRALTAKIVEELRPEPVTSPTPAGVPPAGR